MGKSVYRRKCYCTEPLRPDGTCKWGCPPEARAPGKRAARVDRVQRDRDRRAGIGLRVDHVREAAAKVVPELSRGAISLGARLRPKMGRRGR